MVLFRSIRSKIIVGVVALLLLMAVSLTVVATERTETALRARIIEAQDARAGQVGQSLASFAEGVKEAVAQTARTELLKNPVTPEQRTDNGTVKPDQRNNTRVLLTQIVRGSTVFSSSLLVNLSGQPLLSHPPEIAWTLAEEPNGSGIHRYEVLAEIAVEEKRSVSFITRGTEPGTWEAVATVRDQGNSAWAILVVGGHNEELARMLEEANVGAEEQLFLVDSQGVVLVGPPGYPAGYDLRSQSATLARSEEGHGVVEIDQTDYLASQLTIPDVNWRIILATEEEAAFAAVDDILRSTVLISLVALLVGVVLSLVLGHDVGVPVRRLITGAERVTAGEYGTQVRVSTRDELADLAGAFNSMSARLLEENQRLIRYQETLEDTVAERTRELREKNDELEAFVYAASHDLRTPIISLDWLVRELADAIPGDQRSADVEKALARMEANIEGMDDMVADLLELSRIGRTEGEPGPVPLSEVVGAALDELGARLRERGMTVEVELQTLPVVRADRRRMHQVFLNLLGNAIKYGPDTEGRITVRALPIGDPRRPVKWRIEVADNGPGVAEEHRDRVFMLFQRAPDPLGRNIEGTGIGLALVRKIVRAYGGDVRVGDAPGGGALFWLTLPSMNAPDTRAARPAATSAPATGQDAGAGRPPDAGSDGDTATKPPDPGEPAPISPLKSDRRHPDVAGGAA